MKITTELKNLIKRSFDEKRVEVKRQAKENAILDYEKFLNEFEKSKEFKAYAKAAQNLYDAFKEQMVPNNYASNCKAWSFNTSFTNLNKIEAATLCWDNTDVYVRHNETIAENVREKINAIDLAQESLMIKLTYEKDIETIRTMLAEYNIII